MIRSIMSIKTKSHSDFGIAEAKMYEIFDGLCPEKITDIITVDYSDETMGDHKFEILLDFMGYMNNHKIILMILGLKD